jgi:tRNA G46 methylase TrmB
MIHRQANKSRQVSSNQQSLHPQLEKIVTRHLHSKFKRPIALHNQSTFEYALNKAQSDKIIYDSGCGNGKSTLLIAQQHPNAFVIGIDKSSHRLGKAGIVNQQADNALLVRADLLDFLRLAAIHKIRLYKHFILYPNPWPKKHHFIRRWHGSPVFKDILRLGGILELRSNWPMYIDEFGVALRCANQHSSTFNVRDEQRPFISDFEEKYFASGHQLTGLRANLNIDSSASALDN